MSLPEVRATTVLAVRKDGAVAMGGDGQVTMGDTVVKNTARKVRVLMDGRIIAGFAGAVADAFTLFEKLEEKLERYPANMPKAVVELAKDWRMDRYLRRLDALLAVADSDHLFLVSGNGDVIEPDDDGAVANLVSLGIVDPEDPGSFDVPAGYDPTVFSVVDISVEPRDGDDTHSGRSILRAGLDFA